MTTDAGAWGEGPTTRSPAAEAGGDHRDAGHDPALVPPVDRAEVGIHIATAEAARDHERDLRPHRPDRHGEFWLGLHSDPGGAEEPWPPGGEKHGGQGIEEPRDPDGARAALVVAHVSARPIGVRSLAPTSSRQGAHRWAGRLKRLAEGPTDETDDHRRSRRDPDRLRSRVSLVGRARTAGHRRAATDCQ